MAGVIFYGGKYHSLKDDGTVNNQGTLTFYEPGTSTLKAIYTDADLSVPSSNPVTLNSAGRPASNIYLNGNYDVVVKDSSGNTIYTQEDINPTTSVLSVDLSKIVNGSFEAGDTTPEDWVTTTFHATSTAALDDTTSYHGANSMKFTSTGNGGGYITSSSFFEVDPSMPLLVSFVLKSSVVNVRNVVEVLWYTAAQAAASTASTSLYDDSATNPTSFTLKQYTTTPPSDARYAKIKLTGCHNSVATAGSTWFDDVRVIDGVPGLAADNTFSGVNTFSGANIFSGNNTFSGDNDIKDTLEIYDPDDTTKKVRLDVAGVTTGNTRVLSVPDRDMTIGIVSGTATASTSGTAVDFTGIPSWVRKITISFVGVSTSGASALAVQIGDSGGFETTGYLGAGANLPNAAATAVLNSTAVFLCMHSNAAAAVYHGACVLTLVNAATNTWSFASTLGRSDSVSVQVGAGSKSLSATLDRVRITTAGGVDTFDAGTINILYE